MTTPNIEDCIYHNLQTYFKNLEGETPSNIYDMVLHVVEKPMLALVMEQAGQNQSRAADWLGLNRNTLRKKLIQHGLLG